MRGNNYSYILGMGLIEISNFMVFITFFRLCSTTCLLNTFADAFLSSYFACLFVNLFINICNDLFSGMNNIIKSVVWVKEHAWNGSEFKLPRTLDPKLQKQKLLLEMPSLNFFSSFILKT